MKLFHFLFCLSSFSCSFGQNTVALAEQAHNLYQKIVLNTIPKKEAQSQWIQLFQSFNTSLEHSSFSSKVVFPLKGYSVKQVGGKNGNGYLVKGYNFFDGNQHTAHPAQDIFIHDNNQDDLDDRTKKPVEVLSMMDGIVVSMSTTWEPLSTLRGGNYVLIYAPQVQQFFYYAHNSKVLVQVGDKVIAGQTIAHVGRTGLNAYKKRSPTHLHLSQFNADTQKGISPINVYILLLKAQNL
jgi:murein DD-endopeptidase MepM/ murein hydrolase activator NlpD